MGDNSAELQLHMMVDPNREYNYSAIQDAYLMARAAACRSMPYLGQLLVSMPYTITLDATRVTESGGVAVHCPTIAVSTSGHIFLHPEFVERLLATGGGVPALGYILAHEAMHVLFRHHKRAKDLQTKEGDAFDADADGLAADLTINPALSAVAAKPKPGVIWIKDPAGDCAGVQPSHFKLEDGLAYEQYYYALHKKKQSGGRNVHKNCGQPAQGCSIGAPGGEGQANPKLQQQMQAASGLSNARQEILANSVLQKAKEHEARNRGSVPADIMQEIQNGYVEPKVRWQDLLKAKVFHAIQHREGAEDAIWTKTARKQGGLGHGTGTARLPGYVEYRPTVCVLADTSGSMSSNLEDIRDETMGIIHECGADVEFIACDSEAHEAGKVGSVQQIAANLKGGGGTDMNPGLDLASKKKSDVVVCITDGYIGPFGDNRGYRLIFCVVPGGTTNGLERVEEEGWGAVVQIEGS